MLKFTKPKTVKGYKQIDISKNDSHYGIIWTYYRSPNWYASLSGGKKTYIFSHKKKKMALNEAFTFIQNIDDIMENIKK